MANLLKSLNIKKGDKIAIYMPSSIMAVVSLLACARIGAVHNIVFAGFSGITRLYVFLIKNLCECEFFNKSQ